MLPIVCIILHSSLEQVNMRKSTRLGLLSVKCVCVRFFKHVDKTEPRHVSATSCGDSDLFFYLRSLWPGKTARAGSMRSGCMHARLEAVWLLLFRFPIKGFAVPGDACVGLPHAFERMFRNEAKHEEMKDESKEM